MQASSRILRNGVAALVLFTGVLLGAGPRVMAVEVLDQSQEAFDAGFSLDHGPTLQQTFRPAYANICAMSLYMMDPASVTLEFIDVLCGRVVRTATASTNQGYSWVKVQFVPPIDVTPEQEYAFRALGTPGASSYLGKQNNLYDRGALYLNCNPLGGGYDATFRTYAEDALVPVGTTVWSDVKHLYR